MLVFVAASVPVPVLLPLLLLDRLRVPPGPLEGRQGGGRRRHRAGPMALVGCLAFLERRRGGEAPVLARGVDLHGPSVVVLADQRVPRVEVGVLPVGADREKAGGRR